ncbi:hypothetical protein [Bacillus altitudinis]|uniref:hypothetical protein n=1 Tax=Bacillus altitudinis TaxID=293387 RepID=UPI003315B99F
MIKYKFIAFIYDLRVDRAMNRGTKIFGNLRISNSSEKISQMFHYDFKNAIGRLEYDYLLSGPYFYVEGEIEKDNIFEEDTLGINFLNTFMEKIQFVNNCFWLIKDNSIHIENAYLQLENGDKTKFHSNSRTAIFNSSKGEREEVTFSADELKYPEEIFNITYSDDSVDSAVPDKAPLYMGSRVERAFYLLQAARAQSYLPERISIFITLLETLFSTSNTDVTYKLRERVAWLLGKDFEGRKQIFDDMGVIYDIRSNHVHNSTVPNKAKTKEDLILYSTKLEEYVRLILIKILTEGEINKLYQKNNKGKYEDKELEKFFKDICLGKSQD